MVSGVVSIDTKQDLTHNGLMLTLEGLVDMEVSTKTVGRHEALYQSTKPIQLIFISLELLKPGKLPAGKTPVPFEMELTPKKGRQLYESYKGVYISVQYYLVAEMKRSMLQKDLTSRCDILVHYKTPKSDADKAKVIPREFCVTPDSLQNVKRGKYSLPSFCIRGRLDSSECCMQLPITGFLNVEACEKPIKSIELQLIRVETCGCAEGYSKELTEIENLQIAEGDVSRSLEIPIYLLLPRLFTCPTICMANFKIEFEMNIVVIFHDDHLVTENFPLKITRF